MVSSNDPIYTGTSYVMRPLHVVGKDKKKDDEPTSTGKSPDPQSFDGNPEELERFLRQLSNKFALERRHYKQDIDKIRYASLL
jgi:hypothetical protein